MVKNMRMLHLCLRLLLLGIIVTGAVSSIQVIDTSNSTAPFLISGYVCYEDGYPSSNIVVNITNLNVSMDWQAETEKRCNYYELVIDSGNVSAGNVLKFNATDGTGFNSMNRTVGLNDLESGGIFDLNLTLTSVAPRIMEYAPKFPVHDIENATRTFNITIDQMVNVTWWIDSSPVQTNESVTDASYTHKKTAIGVWNISVRASNVNGTDIQEWTWRVNPLSTLPLFDKNAATSSDSNATQLVIVYGWVLHENSSGCIGPLVNISNFNTGMKWQAETHNVSYYYQLVLDAANVSDEHVLLINASKNGTSIGDVAHTVNQTEIEQGAIEVNINRWMPDLIIPESGVSIPPLFANKTNTINVTVWNNGTGASGAFNISFSVNRQANTSCEYMNETRIPGGLQHRSSVNISFSWQPSFEEDYNITFFTDSNHEINESNELNNNLTMTTFVGVPDFIVTNLTLTHKPLVIIGDIIRINATIANVGTEGEAFVSLYDNKSITIERMLNDYPETPINDTITLPDVKRIRVHLESFDVSSTGNITIYNETRLVERINGTGTDHWTEWCDGGTIRLKSQNAGFTVDRYEAVLADEHISLGAGNSTNISAVWNLSDQFMGWAVHGSHNITVRADPDNELVECDETNNEMIKVTYVNPSLDFAVTEISLNITEPVLGDIVGVSANISNYGVRNGTTVVGVCYDNRSIEIERKIPSRQYSTDNISLPADVHGLRIRFSYYELNSGAYINIYDKNGRLVERIHQIGEKWGSVWIGRDYWTDYIYSNAVTIEMYSGHGSTEFKIDRYEALIAEKPVTLNVTESKVINASWLTGAAYGAAREHNITVMVDPRNHFVETNETNNTRSEGIIVNGTDLTVTGIEIPYDLCYMGQDVEVTATMANIGAVDAINFTVIFRDGTCLKYNDTNTSGAIFNETHVERLNISENMTISVIWNPAETGYHTITARIPYAATDNNEANNELSDCLDVEARYGFYVESVNVDPQTAEKADSVNITAIIGNSNVSHTGGNVSVAFFVNSTDFAGTCGERFTRIRTNDSVHLEVNETKTVSVSWNVDVVGGCHMIAAVVNPDNKLEELDCGVIYLHDTIRFRGDDVSLGNNVKNCTLQVNPLDLDIINITLDSEEPNSGDLVNVSATIINNGGAEVNSTVWFYMQSNESIYRRSSWGEPQSWSSALQPEVPIRFHFDYIKIKKVNKAGKVNASVTDKECQHHPVCFYVKYGEGHDAKTSKIDYDTHGYVVDGVARRWNDVWTDWTNGTAVEINAISEYDGTGSFTMAELSIDKYQLRLGNRTVTLSAGESGLYNVEWNTSPPLKPGKNYTILANVEKQRKESNVIRLGGTDLTITDLSVKPVVWDGEAVWVNATIENLGRMDAAAFTVKFTEIYRPEEVDDTRTGYDHLETITGNCIEGLGSGNSTNISVLWNASIREIECTGKCGRRNCKWIEIADDYTIRVKIDPLENLDLEEDDSTNHSLLRNVHVDYSRDFNVTNLLFSVNGTARDPLKLDLYDDVILNATVNITNILNQNGSVDVGFYIDEFSYKHKIGSYSITFDGGNGTGYAEIEWNVMCSPGEHDVIVVADPGGKIQEINETNNILTQKIFVNAPELVLESLDVYPMNPMRGETVSINVTIANVGRKNVSDVVTLCIYDWAERHIENLCEQSGPEREQIEITRENATAMKLYLDLEVEDGCKVCINDGSGSGIICYDKNFHGWTPWMFDNSTTIVVTNTETKIASARVGKVYYIAPGCIIDTSVHDLKINEPKSITVNWNTSVVGERFIVAIVDPEGDVTEYNESNNRLAEFISVQTADLIVSNLSLWLNGTNIGEDDAIKHGDNVTIKTYIANIGVEGAGNFSVRFFIDDIPIEEERILGLADGSTISLVTNWSATVGCHLIKVEVNWENEIDETNETNNIVAWERYVSGAELSGAISWETSGLHGEVLFGPTEPYDEDEVVVTAAINNSGSMPAANFSAALFFDYTPFGFQKRCRCTNSTGKWINKTYPGAKYLYLNVSTPVYVTDGRCMIKDDVIVYDGSGSEVARPYKSCSVLVNGNTTNVFITPRGYSSEPVFDIYFYPIYQNGTSMLFDGINVPANSSHNISMNRTVSVGDFTIMAVIDPKNKVPEDKDHRTDNILSGMMSVKPTRDFTVMSVTAAYTNLLDLDTTKITAEVSNIGLRNGTTNVSFVDHEQESRTYKYHFNRSFNQSYLPIPPDATLSGLQYHGYVTQDYENLMMIHRLGVDTIELHLNEINLDPPSVSDKRQGVISVRDENEEQAWIETYISKGKSYADIRVPGETTYIYTCKASFNLDGYTTEKEFLKEEVRLNSTKDTNESKNIKSMWNASTGDHVIAVTLDKDGEISEISESNNELSQLFHVNASRDPAIIGLNITPEHPMDGDDVDISAIIANNGSKNASFTFDLWVNTTQNEGGTDASLPGANLTTDLGDRIRYISLLKHANLTLAPGENVTVNATWNDISVFGSPIHRIIAIVDPLDEIDEMNESNNEIEKEIIMAYPDLTIGGSYVRGGTGKPVVNIKEIGGISGASDVTVRFESYETMECNKGCGCIRHPGASNMQVYFDHIDVRNGYVEVRDRARLSYRKPPVAIYSGGEFSDVWSPWVEGDSICIKCRGGGTWVRITEYRWGNVSDEQIDHLGSRDIEKVEMPWTEYREPYDLNVTVDPDNNITELDEDNNNETIRMGADIAVSKHLTTSPYAPIMGDTCYIRKIRNIGNLHTGEFNVTLYINATDELAFEHNTTINETISLAPNEEYIFPWETPEVEPPDDIDYDIRIVADPEGVVKELDESNNEISTDNPVTVYSHTNYTGGKLYLYDTDWVYGNINYTIGDSTYGGGGAAWNDYVVNFEDVIPENIKGRDVKLARLYLYWTWSKVFSINERKYVPVPAEVNVKFNDGWISEEDRRYLDYPHATKFDVAWGTYAYEIPSDAVKPDNTVIVDRRPFKDKYDSDPNYRDPYACGIFGVGLLVIYESDCGVLTNYWINEGGDVIYGDANALGVEDMFTTAVFEGEVEDKDMTNATLWVVVPGGDNDINALRFNNKGNWESAWDTNIGIGHRCVTEHLIASDNTAELQYIDGGSMMSSAAFLFIRYPPDLNVIDLTAPEYTPIGIEHSINVTIRNDGRSNAHDFNVTFYIDGMKMIRIPHLDLAAGNSTTIHLYNWTPVMPGHIYNLTASVDVLSGEDWTEIETGNNALSQYAIITEGGRGNESGPRGSGGRGERTGGVFTEEVTGRVMNKMISAVLGGGGGAGIFSLWEWIIRFAMLTACALTFGTGYWMEQRRHNRRM
ncbi:MAG: hypothetical protein EMLJLAPB_00819 [Candidatus Argoarchaeum ethanivorans]|uniref:CARDB domain-containing protein n=1 Tax=Candidatus Argoarchaeum ethanivorans TaxID=2608793 RepID=A0A811TB15_9EURY|nr:MAG: hypothetical protein EMLJLAPB_00819 [Candidatus Argoarchaeum ethanivorans]